MVKEPDGELRPEYEWSRGGKSPLAAGSCTPFACLIVMYVYRAGAGHLSDADAATGHSYTDGSIENDLPMQQLSELFNVNHFIVSQVRWMLLSCVS